MIPNILIVSVSNREKVDKYVKLEEFISFNLGS
jgi:hypothetical protein